MRTSPRVVGLLCAGALAVSACSSSTATPDPTPSSTTTATSPSPDASPTASEDPFAVPDPVTEEYVDRVVNTIYEEWGAITRELLAEPADPTAITPIETRKRIEALFGGRVPAAAASTKPTTSYVAIERAARPARDFGSFRWRVASI